jgi:hypothetical protein
MEAYQQRVVDELEALREKRRKLKEFIDSDRFKSLSREDKVLLDAQSYIMWRYDSLLSRRIGRFTKVSDS